MNTRNLNTEDLMVGDWVQGNPCGQHCDRNNNTYYKIATLDIGNHCWGYSVCGAIVELKYDDIFLIPLTPEILEKNGFEDIGDDIYQLEEKPCWFWVDFFNHTYGCEYDTSTYEYEDDEHRLKLYGIPSVHELQHALRLCGIEKEIKVA